jgi:hypothetical protein
MKTQAPKKKAQKPKGKYGISNEYVIMPKSMANSSVYRFKRRYIASQAISGAISIASTLSALVMAATTTLGYSPFAFVRIKKIQLWGPVTTIGTPVTVSLQPFNQETDINSFGETGTMVTDTSVSIERPAYVSLTPTLLHPLGSWHKSNAVTANLCTVVAPAGGVLDLTLEGVVNPSTGTQGFTQSLTAATVGNIYASSIMTNFVPVAVLTA